METQQEMRVKKRSGKLEDVSFDKILHRVKKIGNEANIKINYSSLVMKIIDQLYDGIDTKKIDELTAEQCASQSTQHVNYSILASHIIISNHQKNTSSSFYEVMKALYEFKDIHGINKPMIEQSFYDNCCKYKEQLESFIDYKRDYFIDYFGFKTLEKSYLYRINKVILERPQHMWMRVALSIHKHDISKVKESYDLMSMKYFTHATPTLFNAGSNHNQLSSCFLLGMESDSITGIYNTLKDCANISKYAGGIGLHIHNIRATGSHIRGTNGTSNGIVPMLRVFNNTARYVDQCILPDTYLYTTHGPKKIEDCISGETYTFNHLGNEEVIQNILEHPYEGNIYEIYSTHSLNPLTITGEHPVLCLSGQKKGTNYDYIKNRLDHNHLQFTYKEVNELTCDDMLVFSIPQYIKDQPNLTSEDCYFYGIVLGDGCMSNTDKNGYISLHTYNKRNILEFCEQYFTNKCVQYFTDVNDNTTRIRWNKNISIPIRYSDVYDEQKEKYIQSKWLNLPLHKMKYIIKGLIDTDGCKHNELTFDTTSQKLLESMRYMLLKMGIPTSGYLRDRIGSYHNTNNGVITHKKLNYVLRIPQTQEICELFNIDNVKQFYKFFRYNNYLCSRIKDIKISSYNGTLYDLQMKNVHNYLTHNGIIHNGGGKRNGSFAIYLEPWHADIFDFLEMRKNHGDEETKARDLFYGLWIPDLFMKRVKEDGTWTLMCPDECPGLSDCYGEAFEELYVKYENEQKGRKTINARELWIAVLDSQMETGTPYLLYKDAANKKSNQNNIGVIKSSNLCTEIIEYSDDTESAVCNLASIGLSSFVCDDKSFDYEKLHYVSKVLTENLNKIIDMNFYPTEKTHKSNMLHRPIGIGVQGLADTFALMNIPFCSDDAKIVNKKIFETIYHGALERSCELSQEEGEYETFHGSPASKGVLQFDLWNVTPSDMYDWKNIKDDIIKSGLRNSLLLAPMPTASTSQILGNNECFEPFTSNIYSRSTIAGEFIIVNKYLQKELIDLELWSDELKDSIILNRGSIQHINGIPQHIKDKYKIVWEIPMKHIIDMSVDRGAFICQSQSLNLWQEDPSYSSLSSMHFYGWEKGLKTGMYYLRRKARHQAQQFTIDPEKNETCEMCSG